MDKNQIPNFIVERKELPEEAFSISGRQFEIIKNQVTAFQQSLDAEHDIALLLASFGQTIEMEVTGIEYIEPYTLIFKGFVAGRESKLIQHVNQLNFLMTSVKKDPDKPMREIGFSAIWAE